MTGNTYHRVLTIAGSDSGGGAGIQADLKTFAALGCFGMSVITALTAQNTVDITAIHKVPAAFIGMQIDAVLDDIGVDAVKIGMLHNTKVIRIIAERLGLWKVKNIVLDPVMVSKSGAKLLNDNAINTLRLKLFPIAAIVTPNIPEASILSGILIESKTDMENAGKAILLLGPKSVLIKGGHSNEALCADLLCVHGLNGKIEMYWFESKRIDTINTHGTGCTLSSAIAAHLAKGFGIKEAVENSKYYISGAIEAGAKYKTGKGHGPVHHFYKLWKND
jgi:hydroxymethylpyrimidine/phosphomethylpyrimidine kinase